MPTYREYAGKWDEPGSDVLPSKFYRLDSTNADDPNAVVASKTIGRVIVTNGPSWSRDGKKFYLADSMTGRIC